MRFCLNHLTVLVCALALFLNGGVFAEEPSVRDSVMNLFVHDYEDSNSPDTLKIQCIRNASAGV